MKKILLSVLMVLLSLPAFAFTIYSTTDGDKVDLYGSVRMFAGYQNSESYEIGTYTQQANKFRYEMYANSRFGATFKIGNFFGNAETNFKGDNVGGIGFRQLYGGYTFDGGHKLTFGQKTVVSATNAAYDEVFFGNNGLVGFGTVQAIRRPAIVYSYQGLDVSFVLVTADINGAANTGFTDKANIPLIELAYALPLSGKVALAYNFSSNKKGKQYAGVHAFHVAALVAPKFGAGKLTASAFYSMNGAVYGMVQSLKLDGSGVDASLIKPSANVDDNGKFKVENVQSIGIALEYAHKINDMVSAVIGAGYQINMSKTYKLLDDKNHALNAYGVYAQAPLSLNRFMKVVPAVGYYNNFLSNTKKETKYQVGTLLAGVYLQAGF